jgi:hypothetical protein
MVFKLAQAAEKSWRRLGGHSPLLKLISGVKFIDGIQAVSQQPPDPGPSPTFRNSSMDFQRPASSRRERFAA